MINHLITRRSKPDDTNSIGIRKQPMMLKVVTNSTTTSYSSKYYTLVGTKICKNDEACTVVADL